MCELVTQASYQPWNESKFWKQKQQQCDNSVTITKCVENPSLLSTCMQEPAYITEEENNLLAFLLCFIAGTFQQGGQIGSSLQHDLRKNEKQTSSNYFFQVPLR